MRKTRNHRGGGLGQSYTFNPSPILGGVDTGISFKPESSCMASVRPGTLSDFSPAGAGGLPGMGGGARRRRRGTRGRKGRKGTKRRQRGGRYSFDLGSASTIAAGTPWGTGIPQVMAIPCESARSNPLNVQAGGVGGIDSAFYTAPTAGYSNTPSTWMASTGAPVQIQTPYDARILNPACMKTGGARRRRSRNKRTKRVKRKAGRRRR
jgi:hypothetical protein